MELDNILQVQDDFAAQPLFIMASYGHLGAGGIWCLGVGRAGADRGGKN